MAFTIRAEVIGARELDRALEQLPRSTKKSVLRRALQKAAKPTAEAAEALAPVGSTGNLKVSIEVGTKLNDSQAKDRESTPDSVEIFVGASWPTGAHAHLLEFGTVKMAAQPFLRPAWDSTKDRFIEIMRAELWAAISKAAKTLARKAEAGTLGKGARRALGG